MRNKLLIKCQDGVFRRKLDFFRIIALDILTNFSSVSAVDFKVCVWNKSAKNCVCVSGLEERWARAWRLSTVARWTWTMDFRSSPRVDQWSPETLVSDKSQNWIRICTPHLGPGGRNDAQFQWQYRQVQRPSHGLWNAPPSSPRCPTSTTPPPPWTCPPGGPLRFTPITPPWRTNTSSCGA